MSHRWCKQTKLTEVELNRQLLELGKRYKSAMPVNELEKRFSALKNNSKNNLTVKGRHMEYSFDKLRHTFEHFKKSFDESSDVFKIYVLAHGSATNDSTNIPQDVNVITMADHNMSSRSISLTQNDLNYIFSNKKLNEKTNYFKKLNGDNRVKIKFKLRRHMNDMTLHFSNDEREFSTGLLYKDFNNEYKLLHVIEYGFDYGHTILLSEFIQNLREKLDIKDIKDIKNTKNKKLEMIFDGCRNFSSASKDTRILRRTISNVTNTNTIQPELLKMILESISVSDYQYRLPNNTIVTYRMHDLDVEIFKHKFNITERISFNGTIMKDYERLSKYLLKYIYQKIRQNNHDNIIIDIKYSPLKVELYNGDTCENKFNLDDSKMITLKDYKNSSLRDYLKGKYKNKTMNDFNFKDEDSKQVNDISYLKNINKLRIDVK